MNIFMHRIPGQAVDMNIKEALDSHDRFSFSLEQPFRGLLVNPFTDLPACYSENDPQKTTKQTNYGFSPPFARAGEKTSIKMRGVKSRHVIRPSSTLF